MYNFGIPSTLKAWFDHVLRAGVTFRYTEAGPEGLLKGKRAIVIESRGGFYSEGPAQAMDSQEPHLRTLLGFIGITDVTFVRAEKLAFGPEAREQAIAAARAELERLADPTSRAPPSKNAPEPGRSTVPPPRRTGRGACFYASDPEPRSGM